MSTSKISPKLLRHPVHCLSLGLGSGLLPFFPGTWGTVAAIPFYVVFAHWPLGVYVSIVVVSLLLGIGFCHQTAKALGVHDHPAIVWDEFVGFWITMMAVPLSIYSIVVGFFLFRLFDVIKPWPIRWADRKVTGGLGIMLDDVLAGIASCALLHIGIWILF